jgi:Uma2 family endonuclease
MAAMALLTADDLWQMLSDDQMLELVDGVVRERAGVGALSGAIGANLSTYVGHFLHQHGGGVGFGAKTGFVVSRNPDTVLLPSFAVVRTERLPSGEMWEWFAPITPDLAVEIDSPWTGHHPARNINRYLTAGTGFVWHVRPQDSTITVFTPDAPPRVLSIVDTLDGGDVLPGFRLPLAELFVWKRRGE